jgi:hypothetical protein
MITRTFELGIDPSDLEAMPVRRRLALATDSHARREAARTDAVLAVRRRCDAQGWATLRAPCSIAITVRMASEPDPDLDSVDACVMAAFDALRRGRAIDADVPTARVEVVVQWDSPSPGISVEIATPSEDEPREAS